MNYFALILPKLVSFLILLSVGYFVAWRGILRREGMASIAALLIRVVLPCLSADLLIEQGIDAASRADKALLHAGAAVDNTRFDTEHAETAPAGVCAHAGALHRAGQLQSGLHIRGRVAVLHAEAAARVRKAAGAAGGGAAGDSAAGGISHLSALCAGVSEYISDARRGRAGDEHLLHHLPPVRAG